MSEKVTLEEYNREKNFLSNWDTSTYYQIVFLKM